ncbi:hypothetical protein CAPN001_11360 [Capnocytophaga stomatis]|uniref:hypothetical protein n=1 Tax=Capnocytophaga stomatis TaxID=1848904 RepID=UPI0019518AB4|nr:hypothetical protein [Capnocytophaga stomatis]GIJ96567.1 hypothetical protein CAPN001_11360 [Capnocytophaga stomatis]
MEQIIITKPNGNSFPLLSKRGTINVKSATQNMALLGEDVVNISVETTKKQNYEIGDTINIFGRTYKMNQLPKIQKTGPHSFSYDLVFEGIQYDLIRVTFDLTIDTTNNQLQDFQANTLTGNLRRFAEVLLANVARVFPLKWELGNCPETANDKTLTFGESDNCLLVLQNLCKEFGTEFYIEQKNGKNIIHFGKVGQIFPHSFSYGKGKGIYKLERQNVSSSNIITRLKVYGSTKNITNKYRANRLCLPNKSKQQSYIENPEMIAKYGIWEATKHFENIAPTRTGTITGVVQGNVLKFVDSEMFNLNEKEADGQTTKYLLPNTTAKIHFNTGNLAGYQFDVQSYDHATRTFTIKKLTDERNDSFPNVSSQAFQFAIGDKYKLIDIALPPEFEQQAEQDLLQAGQKYYEQNSQPKVQYALSVSEDFIKRKMVGNGVLRNVFSVGDYIPIVDEDINVDKSIRIQSFQREIFKPYQYTLTISDSVSTSIVNRIISDLIEVDKVVQINQLQDPIKAKRGWRDSQEIFNKVFDNEGYFDVERIKPLSIETGMINVGSRMQQFTLPNVTFLIENNNTSVRNTAGQLVHLTIEDTPRTWQIPESVQVNIDADFHYIYVRAWRIGAMASIYISKEQIKVDAEAGYYYFLAGSLGSLENGFRRIKTTYGFTQVSPFEITTGRIAPPSGNHYIELLHDRINIVGNLHITDGNINQIKQSISPDLLSLENRLKAFSEQKVNALQIGGVNILRGTKEFIIKTEENHLMSPWGGSGEIVSEHFNGNAVRKINGNWQGFKSNINNIINEPVIISFWAKTNSGGKFGNFALGNDPATSHLAQYMQLSNNGNLISDGQWHRYTMFNPRGMNFGKNVLNGFLEFHQVTGDVLVSSLKIEKGAKVTDWSPAPEDVEQRISDVRTDLETALENAQELLREEDRNIKKITQKLEQKTDFINGTKINGNTVATGAVMVGNSFGGNAGINGSGASTTDVRFWAGANFANRANASFRVLDNGEVHATNAHISGDINATRGNIGGFDISHDRLQAGSFNQQGLALSNRGIIFREDPHSTFVGLGNNVMPSALGVRGLQRLEYTGDSSSAIGLYVKVRPKGNDYFGNTTREALHIDGNYYQKGATAIFEDEYIGEAYSDIIETKIGRTHTYVFTNTSGYVNVRLPNANKIQQVAGANVTFELSIVIAWSSNGRVRIKGVEGGHILDNNGNRFSGGNGQIDMERGDTLRLRYYSGDYYVMNLGR